MGFYIKKKMGTILYKEDGTATDSRSIAKSYDTEAAAQAVIDSNPSWITTLKNAGETMIIEEIQ